MNCSDSFVEWLCLSLVDQSIFLSWQAEHMAQAKALTNTSRALQNGIEMAEEALGKCFEGVLEWL